MYLKHIKTAIKILPLLLAAICLILVVRNDNQASMPVPCELIFTGEYSYDGEHWYPYNENSVLSALEGEVTVKGHFDTDISEGAILNFYCNHIGVSIDVNGEPMYVDAPAEIMSYGAGLTPSMCGKRWEQILCPAISAEDELEFRLCNYHKHGNESAYKEVLSTCFITPLDKLVLEAYLTPYIKPFEMIGTAFLIVSLMLFGATLSTTVLKSGIAKQLFKMGVITLFVGGYIMFDVMMVFFKDELLVMKTYGAQVCRMLAVYFLGSLLCNTLTETNKKAAEIAMLVSGITNALILLFVISGTGLLYDTKYVWESVQCGISLLFLVLCLAEIKKAKKIRRELIIHLLIHTAILLDMAGVGYHMYCSGVCFKIVMFAVLIFYLLCGARQMVTDYQASIKNVKLKEELENSHVALMLSQIQPHFIYNTLGTIGEFCEEEPKKAAELVQKFSLYLRGNFTELDNPMPIRVAKELEHVRHYADIEQIRFPDMKVEYDIQSDRFLIPALTIQPLVENAIKHGLMGLESGGTVKISCYEYERCYEICVKDNGVGFDASVFEDGKKHIGIKNVRKRIESMCGGTLTIDSVIGQGTIAIIRIPKEGAERDSDGGR